MEYCEMVRMLKGNEGECYDYECYVEIKDGENTYYGPIEGVNFRYKRNDRIMSYEEALKESQQYNINLAEYWPVVVIGQCDQNISCY